MATNNQLTITVTAKDGTKQTFTLIAADAQAMAAGVQKAGTTAAKALDDVGTHAKTAGAAVQTSGQTMAAIMESVNKHAALLGSVIGTTLVNSMREFGAAGEQNAQAARQLEVAVNNTGTAFETVRDRMEAAAAGAAKFGISDDLATNALQALTEQTGNAGKAMDLLQVTEDLAAAKHMNLVDAANLIGKVYNGNVSILQRYGISLAAGTSATDALTEIQTRFSGQAQANTTVLSHFSAEIDNWKGAVGEAIGPFAGIISLLPSMNAGMQIASAAGGLVADAFRAQRLAATEAATAVEVETIAVEANAAASESAALASGGLAAALTGPAGLIIGGIALAAGIGYLITRHHDQADALDKVTTSVEQLNDAYNQLSNAGLGQSALGQLFSVKAEAGQLPAQYQSQLDAIKTLQDSLTGMAIGPARDAINGQIQDVQALIGSTDELGVATANVNEIYNHIHDSGVDTTRVTGELSAAFDKYQTTVAAGHPDFVSLEADIAAVRDGMYAQTLAATQATDVWTKLGDTMQSTWTAAVDPLKNVNDEIAHIFSSTSPDATAWQAAAKSVLATFKEAIDSGDPARIAAAYQALADGMAQVDLGLTISENNRTAAINAATDAYHQQAAVQQSMSDQIVANNKAQQASIEANTTALKGYQGQAAQMQASSDQIVAANIAQQAAEAKARRDDAYNQMNTASIQSSAQGSYAATQAANLPSIYLPTPAPDLHGSLDQAAASYDATRNAVDRLGSALRDTGTDWAAFTKAQQDSLDANIKTAAGFAQATGGVTNFLDALATTTGAGSVQVAAGLSDINAELSDMTRIVIDNTDAIANNSDKLFKWADDLIGAEGVYSKLDDLVNAHKISGTSGVFTGNSEYAQAQQAYNAIAKDNLRVQTATQVIQAKQAPLLADLADKQAAYLEQIEKWPADQQLATLGLMDSNEQLKLQSTIALAASAAQGKIGPEARKASTAVIESAVAADPALGAMLEKIGLISVDHDTGKITLNMDGFETTQTAIDKMTDAVKALTDLLSKPIVVTTQADVDKARFAVDSLADHIEDIPASWTTTTSADTAQATIDVGDFQSLIENLPDHTSQVSASVSGLSDVDSLRNSIDGLYDRNVSVYATTYTQTVPVGVGPLSGNYLGGVIQRHASGGSVLSWLAEAGPEALDFPGGGHGMAYGKGVYSVPDGTFVHTAPATKAMGPGGATRNFNHYGNVYHYPSSGASARDQAQAAILGERR